MRTMCVVLLFAGFLPASAGAAEPPSKTVAPAATQPPNEGAKAKAKLLFQAGKAEQAAGHLDEAIRNYELAFQTAPLPGILYFLGKAWQAKGNKQTALKEYRRYLALDPNGQVAGDARLAVAELERQIQAEQEQERVAAAVEAAKQASKAPDLVPPVKTIDPVPPAVMDAAATTPLHKKWWLWTSVAGVVVVGGAVGAGVALGGSRDAAIPMTDLGAMEYSF